MKPTHFYLGVGFLLGGFSGAFFVIYLIAKAGNCLT